MRLFSALLFGFLQAIHKPRNSRTSSKIQDYCCLLLQTLINIILGGILNLFWLVGWFLLLFFSDFLNNEDGDILS